MQALFLPGEPGPRFALYHPPDPAVPARGAVLFVPPFAEELNRSRRQVAQQARAFARAGHAVLLVDPYGCGDSAGRFEDATWSHWLDDVVLAHRWLAAQASGPVWLWGLRTGCLLAAGALGRLGASAAQGVSGAPIAGLLCWQPVLSGRLYLKQFLRFQLAGDLLRGQTGATTETLRARLVAGETLELAGYLLTPALADGLEQAELALPAAVDAAPRVVCLEIGGADAVSPALATQLGRWRAQGWRADGRVVAGPAFWQSLDTSDNPALVEASLAALAGAPAPVETGAVAA